MHLRLGPNIPNCSVTAATFDTVPIVVFLDQMTSYVRNKSGQKCICSYS